MTIPAAPHMTITCALRVLEVVRHMKINGGRTPQKIIDLYQAYLPPSPISAPSMGVPINRATLTNENAIPIRVLGGDNSETIKIIRKCDAPMLAHMGTQLSQ